MIDTLTLGTANVNRLGLRSGNTGASGLVIPPVWIIESPIHPAAEELGRHYQPARCEAIRQAALNASRSGSFR